MVVLSIIAALTGAISWYLFQTRYKPQPMPEPLPEPVPTPPEPKKTARERLYDRSKACIGREMSELDFADDEVGCVESLEGVVNPLLGGYISGHMKPLLSTYVLKLTLDKHPRFVKVDKPLPGDIAVTATGTGNGKVSNGHCAIVGKTHWMSNQSFGSLAGTWQPNYTEETWKAYFETKGGYRTWYYQLK